MSVYGGKMLPCKGECTNSAGTLAYIFLVYNRRINLEVSYYYIDYIPFFEVLLTSETNPTKSEYQAKL